MLAALRVIEDRLSERSLLGSLIDRANLAAPHNTACGVGESYLVIDQRGGVAKCQMENERPIANVHATDRRAAFAPARSGYTNWRCRRSRAAAIGHGSCGARVAARSPPSARQAVMMCSRRIAGSTRRSTRGGAARRAARTQVWLAGIFRRCLNVPVSERRKKRNDLLSLRFCCLFVVLRAEAYLPPIPVVEMPAMIRRWKIM